MRHEAVDRSFKSSRHRHSGRITEDGERSISRVMLRNSLVECWRGEVNGVWGMLKLAWETRGGMQGG